MIIPRTFDSVYPSISKFWTDTYGENTAYPEGFIFPQKFIDSYKKSLGSAAVVPTETDGAPTGWYLSDGSAIPDAEAQPSDTYLSNGTWLGKAVVWKSPDGGQTYGWYTFEQGYVSGAITDYKPAPGTPTGIHITFTDEFGNKQGTDLGTSVVYKATPGTPHNWLPTRLADDQAIKSSKSSLTNNVSIFGDKTSTNKSLSEQRKLAAESTAAGNGNGGGASAKGNANFSKYALFVSDSLTGTYVRYERAIIQNFRTQLRGLGGAGAILLPTSQVNERIFELTIEVGQFVKILDTSKYDKDEYSDVGAELFFGTVSSVSYDIFEKGADQMGFINIDEIGHYYSRKPIVWLSTAPQIFNPIVSGIAYGNKYDRTGDKDDEGNVIAATESNEFNFETILSKMTSVKIGNIGETKFKSDSGYQEKNKKVWTQEDFLRYMARKFGVDIGFPWELDKILINKKRNEDLVGKTDPRDIADINNQANTSIENNEKNYKIFKNSLDIKSYHHYNGQSFQEMLEDVIKSPFDWFIYPADSSGNNVVFQIVNGSPVKAEDYYPAAQAYTKTLSKTATTNFNITKQDEVYDQIIYRGNNILCAGSLSHWNNNGSASMEKNWTDAEEQKYVEAENQSDPAAVGVIRSTNKKVYQQFKYRHLEEKCPIQLAKKFTSNGKSYIQAPFYPTKDGQELYEMKAFFPSFTFISYSNQIPYMLTKPLVLDNLTAHKTPPLLELTWSETLPWIVGEQKEIRKPFIMLRGTEKARGSYFWTYDMTKAGAGDTCSLKHTVDGYQIELSVPETIAKYTPQMFTRNGVLVDTPAYYWTDKSVSERNPADKNNNYLWFGNYKLMCSTLAGYSAQKLEYIVYNENTEIRNKIKVIEDPSLECWFVHGGTIKEVTYQTNGVSWEDSSEVHWNNGFDRFQADTFIRNDFSILFKLANNAANWLFTPKVSAKIEMALMNYSATSWNIGEFVGDLFDYTTKTKINSLVASIEYDCVSNRVNISTAFPEMPVLKRMQQAPMSKSFISPTSDSKEATIKVSETVITKEDYPKHGYVSGGAGSGGTTSVPILTIINGSDEQKEHGIDMVKAITATPLCPNICGAAELYVDGTTDFPDGLGVARLATDGTIQFILNMNPYLPHMLYAGDRILSTSTVPVTGHTIAGTSPVQYYQFEAYILEVII